MTTFGIITGHVVAAIFLVLSACSEGIELPGFQGHVFDEATGRPLENAYVVCFTNYYPFSQRFNLGGPNSEPDTMEIVKTNKSGLFVMGPYKKRAGGWVEERSVFVFRADYVYAQHYFQQSKRKNVLTKRKSIANKYSEDILLNDSIKIYLSNKGQVAAAQYPVNGYLSLLYQTRAYYEHYKLNNKPEFRKLQPDFFELHGIFAKLSAAIIKTFPEPHLIRNWQDDLLGFTESIRER